MTSFISLLPVPFGLLSSPGRLFPKEKSGCGKCTTSSSGLSNPNCPHHWVSCKANLLFHSGQNRVLADCDDNRKDLNNDMFTVAGQEAGFWGILLKARTHWHPNAPPLSAPTVPSSSWPGARVPRRKEPTTTLEPTPRFPSVHTDSEYMSQFLELQCQQQIKLTINYRWLIRSGGISKSTNLR